MSSVQYELSVSSIAKIDAMVTVRADGNYENETFLFNYITKAEYDAISGDKTAGLKAHMDAFIDARVKDWNDSHPNSGVMTRKEFLSRALMNGKEAGLLLVLRIICMFLDSRPTVPIRQSRLRPNSLPLRIR